ncbi:geranylgeranyl pyrophosphate synthase [Pilimelia anulata]|uniref:Geranylgeranyl pyrophosphate synthase n=1 Tax=Pilimelia anulata TaxID=53371 RepID=A0A8J3B0X0_9ACTN|nr:polyprenyl synthetase family protein [Pilimelia anulata]GGJ85327.1 geranylgeranyl pyrophosphate synthase [Pilimelia anulata]
MTSTPPEDLPPTEYADLRARIEKALSDFLAAQRDRLATIDPVLLPVAEELDSFILSGGKRLRPAFGYWGYRAAGGADRDAVVTTLAALELVQASALIHDDVMDDSDTRRGRPAMHRRFARRHADAGWRGSADGFGSAAAILLGDLCLAWSDELLDRGGLDPATLARARPVFDEMRTEVMAGQYLDMLAQATGGADRERATRIAVYKSAKYTVERPLLFGAALAGAPAAVAAGLSAYGLPLGEAFQLRDDVLGVFGDPARTGKPAGDDLREGKRTYLIAAALEGADPAQRAALEAGLGAADLDAAGVERLRGIIVATGALAATEGRIAALADAARRALGAPGLDPAAVAVLTALATAAVHRPA